MDKYLIIKVLLCFFCTVQLQAEAILKGVVTYQNTGERMGFVEISAVGASPVVTKKKGKHEGTFQLYFPNVNNKTRVVLNVKGKNLEVVNREVLAQQLSAGETDSIRIVVCKIGERNQKAIEYYNISTDFINRNHEKELSKKIREFRKSNGC